MAYIKHRKAAFCRCLTNETPCDAHPAPLTCDYTSPMIVTAPTHSTRSLPVRKWRWVVPGAMALALHLLLLLAFDRGMAYPGFARHNENLHTSPIMVSLVSTRAANNAVPPQATPEPAETRRKSRTATAAVMPLQPAESMVAPTEIIAMPAPAAAVPVADTRQEPDVIEPDASGYRFSTPPSVTLKYDVQHANAAGQKTYGHGAISWQVDGERYVIEGDAGVLFIRALSFSSSGTIDSQGVAPELYREKRFRKSEINTHFNRERNQISFSASEKSYPRVGGEQDRASIIWQLAGIGRGDSEKISIGAEIPLFVAGIRDGEIWTMRVIAEEEIATGAGKLRSWHFLRMPRPGTFEPMLDLWLAPELDWYPVRLRQTEANGAWLDMSMTGLRRASDP